MVFIDTKFVHWYTETVPKYSFRRAAKMASRWFRRRVSESLRDCARRLVSTPFGGLSLWRFYAARSRRALNRCSFSQLVSRHRLAAVPVLAWLSSAVPFPWNFRCTLWRLPACVELRGALPSTRWFRCIVSQLLLRVFSPAFALLLAVWAGPSNHSPVPRRTQGILFPTFFH